MNTGSWKQEEQQNVNRATFEGARHIGFSYVVVLDNQGLKFLWGFGYFSLGVDTEIMRHNRDRGAMGEVGMAKDV